MSVSAATAKAIFQNAYLSGGENPYDEGTDEHEYWQTGVDSRASAITATATRQRKSGRKTRRVAVADFETDPPDGLGRWIEPFSFGFFDGNEYRDYWGNDAAASLVQHIRELSEEHVIYAHNGGKFDWQFIVRYLEPKILFIGSRIARAFIKGNYCDKKGKPFMHELRDSFSIIPVPLSQAGDKFDFDYAKMKAGVRERHKKEILEYQKQDCLELYKVVSTHIETFGPALTMASAAMKKLNESMAPENHPDIRTFTIYERMAPSVDATYRQWFFGGRVQCFQKGMVHSSPGKTLKIYDVTSSYPWSMKSQLHPVGSSYEITRDITDQTDFALVDATSMGALPVRQEDGSLAFPQTRAIFHATIHEINAGLAVGWLKIHRVLHARQCAKKTTFAKFIDEYFGKRQERKQWCRENGVNPDHDPFVLFWKLVQNGAYGKFAQNPAKFKDHVIVLPDQEPPSSIHGWAPSYVMPDMQIWARPTEAMFPGALSRSFLNVGTGASITGAARATLLYGLAAASRPVYCDTDSIVCESLDESRVRVHPSDLGAWKFESEGHTIAICEKKLYAFFGNPTNDDKENKRRIKKYGDKTCIKIASKGVALKASEILEVAKGETVKHTAIFPNLKPDGRQVQMTRRVRMNSQNVSRIG